jgi:hypothetical protein
MAAIHGGFGGAELDQAAALSIATAQAVPAETAAVLLRAFAAGMNAGIAEKQSLTKPENQGAHGDQP